MEITRALLLRRTKLTESSLILSWLSAEHGRIQTVAKGARSPKSPFSGRLDLFFDCEIQFAPSRKSDLHRLCEVTLCNPHEGVRRSLTNLQLATYFVRLLEATTEPATPAPELHDLFQRALGHLASHVASHRALIHFEKQLAQLLGILQTNVSPWECLARILQKPIPERDNLLRELAPVPAPFTSVPILDPTLQSPEVRGCFRSSLQVDPIPPRPS